MELPKVLKPVAQDDEKKKPTLQVKLRTTVTPPINPNYLAKANRKDVPGYI